MGNCPDIYINPTYWTTPHPAEYSNLAINVGAGGTSFEQGVTRTIQVTVRNHGTDDSPSSLLQLWWADPSTSFSLQGQIDVDKSIVVPGGDGVGTDGSSAQNFSFTPSSTIVGTNGGHVCLLAQVEFSASPTDSACPVQGHTAPSSAATDARSAIRNIHVYAPPPPPPAPGGGGGGADPRREMSFAFAASNNQRVEDTQLHVRVLEPMRDRERLATLASDRAVHAELANRRVKFAVPDAIWVVEGRERVVLPRPVVAVRSVKQLLGLPRIGRLGPLSPRRAKFLQLPAAKRIEPKGPIDMHLVPGEMRQTIVQVRPCDKEDVAYAVAVDHTTAKGDPIGGLVLVFVKPHNFF